MPEPDEAYDVFLSYNSEDRDVVEQIAIHLLDNAELRPWFDKWALIPGESWVEALQRGLESSATCAVFVGKSGEGPWQRKEVESALSQQVQKNYRVIPVLLPNAPKKPVLPLFLAVNEWVEFPDGLDDDDALWHLECGIRGEPPGQGRPRPRLEDFKEVLSELSDWKGIHNEVHDLLKKVNVPYENLMICHYGSDIKNAYYNSFRYAMEKWQVSCLPQVESVSKKLKKLQYIPDSFLFYNKLQQQAFSIDNIVKKLNRMDIEKKDFQPLYFQLSKFREFIFDVMNTADIRIMVLVEHLQRSSEDKFYERDVSGVNQTI